MARQRNALTGELMMEGISATVSGRTGAVTFRARVSFTDGAGKRHFQGRTFKGYDQAAEWKLETELRIRRGTYQPESGRTVAEYGADWFPRKRRAISDASAVRYETAWRLHIEPQIGRLRIDRVRRADLQRLVDHLATKPVRKGRKVMQPSYVRFVMTIVTSMFGAAMVDGTIPANPATDLIYPTVERAPGAVWSPLQLRRFLAGTRETPLYPVWLFLALTGCRIGEALALRVVDVTLDTLEPDDPDLEPALPTVWIHRTARRPERGYSYDEGTKTGKAGRTTLLEPSLVDALRPLVEDRPPLAFVFTRDGEKPYTPEAVRWAFKQETKRLGLTPIKLHGLRHSAATMMVANGIPDGIVKGILGHRNVATTIDVYTHVSPGMQRFATGTMSRLLGLTANATTSPPEQAQN